MIRKNDAFKPSAKVKPFIAITNTNDHEGLHPSNSSIQIIKVHPSPFSSPAFCQGSFIACLKQELFSRKLLKWNILVLFLRA